MRSEYDELKDDASDEDAVAEDIQGNERRRFVPLPLVRSGAIALCAIAIATAGVVSVVSSRSDAELPATTAALAPRGDSANPAAVTRQTAAADGEKSASSLTGATAKADIPAAGEPSAAGEDPAAAKDGPAASADDAASGTPNAAPAPGEVNAAGDAGSPGVGGGSPSVESGSGHQHAWVAEMKTVDHAAVYQDISHEAVYEKKKWTQCNACLGDITGNVAGHMAEHAAAGEPASYHTEESSVCVAEAWTEYGVLVKDAYSEEVPTGAEVCSCGARR